MEEEEGHYLRSESIPALNSLGHDSCEKSKPRKYFDVLGNEIPIACYMLTIYKLTCKSATPMHTQYEIST